MTIWEVPLQVGQPQTLNITLNSIGYGFSLKWFEQAAVWLLDITDTNGNPLILGIPLVTGCDLLAQYHHLGFVGQLWCATDGNPDAAPNFTSLGDTSHLYYVEV